MTGLMKGCTGYVGSWFGDLVKGCTGYVGSWFVASKDVSVQSLSWVKWSMLGR